MQMLGSKSFLSRERLRCIGRGVSPKECCPFQPTGSCHWQPNIHASLFMALLSLCPAPCTGQEGLRRDRPGLPPLQRSYPVFRDGRSSFPDACVDLIRFLRRQAPAVSQMCMLWWGVRRMPLNNQRLCLRPLSCSVPCRQDQKAAVSPLDLVDPDLPLRSEELMPPTIWRFFGSL